MYSHPPVQYIMFSFFIWQLQINHKIKWVLPVAIYKENTTVGYKVNWTRKLFFWLPSLRFQKTFVNKNLLNPPVQYIMFSFFIWQLQINHKIKWVLPVAIYKENTTVGYKVNWTRKLFFWLPSLRFQKTFVNKNLLNGTMHEIIASKHIFLRSKKKYDNRKHYWFQNFFTSFEGGSCVPDVGD